MLLAISGAGCGVLYDASAKVRTTRMEHTLKAGETTLQVHQDWGEPDMRTTIDGNSEVWSYVSIPNSNDAAATLLYTSTKPGDKDHFLDLKFADNKLVSWNSAEHTMPAKKGAGISYGFGNGGSSPVIRY